MKSISWHLTRTAIYLAWHSVNKLPESKKFADLWLGKICSENRFLATQIQLSALTLLSGIF
jgi:hypothetical protein